MSNLATITNNILADSGIDDINVIVSTGSYANPAWITSLAWTKITGAPANIVTGTGTLNYHAKWVSGSALGNSLIFDDGTNVGINTTSLSKNINLAGTTRHERIFAYPNYVFDFTNSVGETFTWFRLGNATPFSQTRIFYRAGTSTSEEEGEVKVSNTCAEPFIEWTRNTYSYHIREVRARMTGGCGACEIWFLVRHGNYNAGANTNFQWQIHSGTDSAFVVANAIGTPGTGTNQKSINSTDGYFYSNSDNMSIAGRVGIGTTSPTAKLQVVGEFIRLVNSADSQNILLHADTSRVAVSAPNGNLAFDTANAERMRIFSDGNVSISNSPSNAGFKLDVNGTGRFSGNILVNNVATSGYAFTSVAGSWASGSQIYTAIKIGAASDNLVGTGVDLRAYSNYASNAGTEFRLFVNNSSNVLTEALRIASTGAATFSNLAGSGTRMVVADANGLLSTQAIGSGAITGGGATNTIPKFTGSTTIGNSIMQESGTAIQVSGNVQVRGNWTSTFSVYQLLDTRAGGAEWNIENGRTLGNLEFYNGAAGGTKLTLNPSGNLGLGVTPSAWGSLNTSLDFTYGSLYRFSNTSFGIAGNAFYNGSNWIYKLSQAASDYFLESGQHIWRTAPSGTAGNAISWTQAMTLGSNSGLSIGTPVTAPAQGLLVVGNVGIGISPDVKLDVQGSSDTTDLIRIRKASTGSRRGALGTQSGVGYLDLYNDSSALSIRLLADGNSYFNSGNVGIGTASPAQILHLETNLAGSSGVGTALQITSNGPGGDNAWIGVNKGTGNGLEFSVENRDIIFNTAATTPFGGTERMRITSAGTLEFLGAATGLAGAFFANTNSVFQIGATFGGGTTKDIVIATGGSASAPTITFKAGGNLLIGTTSDVGAKLYVDGGIRATGAILSGGLLEFTGAWSASPYNGSAWVRPPSGVGVFLVNNAISRWAGFTPTSDFDINGGAFFVESDNNNVGIGTTTPNRTLHVVGSTRHERVYGYRDNFLSIPNSVSFGTVWVHLGTCNPFTTDKIYYRVATNTSEEEGEVTISNTCALPFVQWQRNTYNPMVVQVRARMTGGCGQCQVWMQIRYGTDFGGTNTNFSWQAYNGTDSGFGIVNAIGTPGTGTNEKSIVGSQGYFYANSGSLFAADNLGIGTTSPAAILHTSTTTAGNSVGGLFANPNQAGTADSVSLNFGLGRTADLFLRSIPAITFVKNQQWTGTPNTVNGYLSFSTVRDEITTERMRIDHIGNILFKGQSTTTFAESIFQNLNTRLAFFASQSTTISKDICFFTSPNSAEERIRITSTGNILMSFASAGNVIIGTTADSGDRLRVTGGNGNTFTDTITTLNPDTGNKSVAWRLGTARGGPVTSNATVRVMIDGVLVDLVARYV